MTNEEYRRRYLNVKTLMLSDSDEVLAVAVAAAVNNGVTYLVYKDTDNNPAAVLLPWGRFNELIAKEVQLDDSQEKNPMSKVQIKLL